MDAFEKLNNVKHVFWCATDIQVKTLSLAKTNNANVFSSDTDETLYVLGVDIFTSESEALRQARANCLSQIEEAKDRMHEIAARLLEIE